MIRLSLEQYELDAIIRDLGLVQTLRKLAIARPDNKNPIHVEKVSVERAQTALLLEKLEEQTRLQDEVTQIVCGFPPETMRHE